MFLLFFFPPAASSPPCFQALGTTFLFFSPPLGGRSWEEPSDRSAIKLKAKMRQDVTSSSSVCLSVCLSVGCFRGERETEKHNPSSSYPAFTASPSQLQSVTIKSLINATGKRRSELGRLETSPYLRLNNPSISLSCDSAVSCRPVYNKSTQEFHVRDT